MEVDVTLIQKVINESYNYGSCNVNEIKKLRDYEYFGHENDQIKSALESVSVDITTFNFDVFRTSFVSFDRNRSIGLNGQSTLSEKYKDKYTDFLRDQMEFWSNVQITTNYDLFEFDPDNRKLKRSNIELLVHAFTSGLTLQTPIVVILNPETDKLIIWDGQHRFGSLKKSGLPILYVEFTVLKNKYSKDVDFKVIVDKLNTAMSGYSSREKQSIHTEKSSVLTYLEERTSQLQFTKKTCKTRRKRGVSFTECVEEQMLMSRVIEGNFLKSIVAGWATDHHKKGWLSNEPLKEEEKADVNYLINWVYATINGLKGYWYTEGRAQNPPMTRGHWAELWRKIFKNYDIYLKRGINLSERKWTQSWERFLLKRYDEIDHTTANSVYYDMIDNFIPIFGEFFAKTMEEE